MIKKLILSTACGLLLSSMIMNAQSRHELSVLGGGGLSTLNYTTTTGNEKFGFGGHVGLGYSFFFNDNFGIGTGGELTFYNSSFTGDFSNSFNTTAPTGEPFLYQATVNGYEESQHAMFVNIPLMFQYQTSHKNRFYAALGGKLGIPVNGTYQTRNTVFEARGFFEEEQMWLGNTDDHRFLGLGDFQMGKESRDLSLKLAFMLSAEAGMKWNLKDNIAFYTGVYADYGLNNIMKDESQTFIAYNRERPEDFQVNSILTSQYNNGSEVHSFTEKVSPLAVGLKIRVSFGLGKRYKEFHSDDFSLAASAFAQAQQKQDLTAIKELLDKYRAEDEKRYQDMLAKLEEKEDVQQEVKVEMREEMNQDRAELTQVIDNYDAGVTSLNSYQQSQLDKKIAIMKAHPTWKVVLVGHTCDIGAAIVNKNIGQERADAVKEYMVKHGISGERLIAVTRGMAEPVVPNTNDANRRKNRRVEFLVTQY